MEGQRAKLKTCLCQHDIPDYMFGCYFVRHSFSASTFFSEPTKQLLRLAQQIVAGSGTELRALLEEETRAYDNSSSSNSSNSSGSTCSSRSSTPTCSSSSGSDSTSGGGSAEIDGLVNSLCGLLVEPGEGGGGEEGDGTGGDIRMGGEKDLMTTMTAMDSGNCMPSLSSSCHQTHRPAGGNGIEMKAQEGRGCEYCSFPPLIFPRSCSHHSSRFRGLIPGPAGDGGGGLCSSGSVYSCSAVPTMAMTGVRGEGGGLSVESVVLHDSALMQEVWHYVVEGRAGGRVQLGVLALVSKGWKEMAASDAFWRPISIDLFPALPGAGVAWLGGGGVEKGGGGGRWGGGGAAGWVGFRAGALQGGEGMGVLPSSQWLSQLEERTTSSNGTDYTSPLSPSSPASASSSFLSHAARAPAAATTAAAAAAAAAASPSAASTAFLRVDCRSQIMTFGKALGEPRYRTTSAWQEGLSMVYEITDAMDNRRLFYGTGPIHVAVGQNVILRLAGPQRHEVSEPFSAADRDPGLERFGSVRDFFKGCHGGQYPTNLRVRVVICDHRTGRMALLYHSGKTAKRHAKVRLSSPSVFPTLPPSLPPFIVHTSYATYTYSPTFPFPPPSLPASGTQRLLLARLSPGRVSLYLGSRRGVLRD